MTSPALTRRQFLGAALGLAGGALATSLPLAGCAPQAYPGPGTPLAFFTPKQWGALDAAGKALWPDLPGQPGAGVAGTATFADALFAQANPRLQADLRQLLDAIEDLTWTTGRLRPFTALSPAERVAYLAAWRDGPLALQRRAFAGLVRLTGMLTYMKPETWPAIAYPGPWIGRFDFGLGLDNLGPLAASPNPNVFRKWQGA